MDTLFDHEGRPAPATKVALRVLAGLLVMLAIVATASGTHFFGLPELFAPPGWVARLQWVVHIAIAVALIVEMASYALRGRGVTPASLRDKVYRVLFMAWLVVAAIGALSALLR